MSEAGERKPIPLDKPSELNPGQGFFDQEPFRTIVQTVATQSGKDPSKLKYALGLEATFVKVKSPLDETVNKYNRDRVFNAEVYGGETKPSPLGIPPEEKDDYEKAIQEMVRMLKPYPLWNEYVRLMLSNLGNGYGFIYNKSGEVKPTFQYKDPKFLFPPNYSEWLRRKTELRRKAKNQRLVGIDEVFARVGSTPVVGETARMIGKTSVQWATKKRHA